MAPANSEVVKNTLRSKFFVRARPLPSFALKGQAVDKILDLKELLLDLEKGKAAGPGGMRPEFLDDAPGSGGFMQQV